MLHYKYRVWRRLDMTCSSAIVQEVVCPYSPWVDHFCCQRPSGFVSLEEGDFMLRLLTLETLGVFAIFLVLFYRSVEDSPQFNTWEKLLVDVRRMNQTIAPATVTWGSGLIAEEKLVNRLKNVDNQLGIILKCVSKRIGPTDVVKGITCWIQPGQLVAIIGPRGVFLSVRKTI